MIQRNLNNFQDITIKKGKSCLFKINSGDFHFEIMSGSQHITYSSLMISVDQLFTWLRTYWKDALEILVIDRLNTNDSNDKDNISARIIGWTRLPISPNDIGFNISKSAYLFDSQSRHNKVFCIMVEL